MADLKAGSTVGGNPIWHAGTFPLVPAGNSLTYRGKKVYTEIDKPQAADNDFVSKANGGSYSRTVTFETGLRVQTTGSGGMELVNGGVDGATLNGVNAKIKTWWGLGFESNSGSNGITIAFDLRSGNITTKGGITSNNQVSVAAAAPTANSHLTRKDYVDELINTVSNVANAAVKKAGDTMTGVLRANAGVVIVNKATSGEYAPRLDQVISRGVTIDFGTY
ncbi:tail fibers protein [Klebsiella phage vB_KpnM_17-11]|jgi:hypothetical protein|nr:tail fibers protein [Klebsiella phage vB_KpnM_17-11]WKM80777.1 hinge connector of long tail fiber, distal connector [Klebsiella phage ValerieMcCarty04]WKW88780.1 hypothetical protein pzkkv61_207 [Klebsiella phage pzk-kv6-1]